MPFYLALCVALAGLFGVHTLPVADDRGDPEAPAPVEHVIHISVDGLRADAITRLSEDELPAFYRLRREGAFTDNARTDFDRSNTLPNHTSQLTGRGVVGERGHNWTANRDPATGETLHSNRGSYVASVFDVAHDHGRRTALYASKSKFTIFDVSYDEHNGAPDRVGPDDGRDKIDRFVFMSDTDALVERFVEDMRTEPYHYSFLHLRDPDTAGHWRSWSMKSGSSYMRSVRTVDSLVGRVIEMVESTPALAGNTVIILTADHGGGGSWRNHGNASDVENFTIPFYVWGSGVHHAELYALNRLSRRHPGMKNPAYSADGQPIRNGDAGNLALSAMGLPAVSGSTINAAHDLRTYPGGQDLSPAIADSGPE